MSALVIRGIAGRPGGFLTKSRICGWPTRASAVESFLRVPQL